MQIKREKKNNKPFSIVSLKIDEVAADLAPFTRRPHVQLSPAELSPADAACWCSAACASTLLHARRAPANPPDLHASCGPMSRSLCLQLINVSKQRKIKLHMSPSLDQIQCPATNRRLIWTKAASCCKKNHWQRFLNSYCFCCCDLNVVHSQCCKKSCWS